MGLLQVIQAQEQPQQIQQLLLHERMLPHRQLVMKMLLLMQFSPFPLVSPSNLLLHQVLQQAQQPIHLLGVSTVSLVPTPPHQQQQRLLNPKRKAHPIPQMLHQQRLRLYICIPPHRNKILQQAQEKQRNLCITTHHCFPLLAVM